MWHVITYLFVLLSGAWVPSVHAGEVMVALATNFASTFRILSKDFQDQTGHRVIVSTGSSGKLYAHITHGAPFDVFFSADAERPIRLEREGLAVKGSRMTYAIGRLTLWSFQAKEAEVDGKHILQYGTFKYLAIANPKTAPYGQAARETLERLGLWSQVHSRLVQGENIGQAFQYVASGNAQWGLVALSQVLDPAIAGGGTRWDVPRELYQPLRQDVVLLVRGQANPAALALLEYVQGPQARRVIKQYGYDLE